MSLSDQPAPNPPDAGWYPDPLGGSSVRYFDGSQWTGQIRSSEENMQLAREKSGRFPRPHWRKMTWVLVIWSVIFAIWIIAGIAGADSHEHCAREAHAYLSQKSCEDARNAGTGIGVAVVFFLWFLGFVVLSFVWLMTRPKGRICPACGERVKKGRTECPSCGHDFAAAARAAIPQTG
jgi:hypothetical protein